MFFSIIIPLYNRPQEIKELLSSLLLQTYQEFEVLVIEDGSKNRAEDVVYSFADRLRIKYFYKENEGQGFARNYGFERASGDYFIIFDSDILVPENYLQRVMEGVQKDELDAFGGPDAAHYSFTPVQKAISYSMTSPLTTGGIRGNKKHIGKFHPRSFNMGISKHVWETTRGFKLSRRSEDIEFSIRMIESGFKVGLIPDAFVYHKRRTNLIDFFKQTYGFGKGRIEIAKLYPKELKLVHAFPAIFTIAFFSSVLIQLITCAISTDSQFWNFLSWCGIVFPFYILAIFVHSLIVSKSIRVAILAPFTAMIQLIAYGSGFIVNGAKKAFSNNK